MPQSDEASPRGSDHALTQINELIKWHQQIINKLLHAREIYLGKGHKPVQRKKVEENGS